MRRAVEGPATYDGQVSLTVGPLLRVTARHFLSPCSFGRWGGELHGLKRFTQLIAHFWAHLSVEWLRS